MAKLIAFYSRADENYFGGTYRTIPVGNTERAALMLARLTGADLFKIEQKEPYSANYQQCIAEAKRDLQANARPALVTLPADLDAYDEIYLGYPNYWGTMPMAVYTVNDIRKAAKGADVRPGLAIHGSDVDHAEAKLKGWI